MHRILFKYLKKSLYMKRMIYICFLCFFIGCSNSSSHDHYRIAFDPSWYVLNLPGRESTLTSFTIELIEAISQIEKKKITLYQASWDTLFTYLKAGQYDAVCSTLQPYLFYDTTFSFSQTYLRTGPVMIIPITGRYHPFDRLDGKEIGVIQGSSSVPLLSNYPEALPRFYDSVPVLLSDTSQGILDGCLVDRLTADAFVHDLFYGQLKIVTPPMNEEGIRFVALKTGASSRLIELLDRGLIALKENGAYSALLKKWRLSEEALSVILADN